MDIIWLCCNKAVHEIEFYLFYPNGLPYSKDPLGALSSLGQLEHASLTYIPLVPSSR
jgi:hypothetical protein